MNPSPRRDLLSTTLALLAVGACKEPSTVVLDVTPGLETDAFQRPPQVSRVDVVGVSPEGDLSLGATSAPGGSFDLGEIPKDRLLTFSVAGYDATAVTRIRGRSLGVVVGALDSDVLPIFVQRIGEWARPPAELPHSHVGGLAAVVGERFLLVTGGDSSAPDGANGASYDLLTFGTAAMTLPRTARSLVVMASGSAALLVDDDGASWVDFTAGTSADAALPAGLTSFAAVAGGRTVEGAEGVRFVVGGTRPASATAEVLVVAADGNLTAAHLTTPRAGAAATWLDGAGLVVAAGSDVGAGLEVMPPGATQAAERSYAPDPTSGAAAVVRGQNVVLLGGMVAGAPQPARSLAVDCASSCAPQVLGDPLPEPLVDTLGYPLGADRIVVVGADSGGQCRSYQVDLASDTATEILLREPRRGAAVVPAPNGTLALLGGALLDDAPALHVELLEPSSN